MLFWTSKEITITRKELRKVFFDLNSNPIHFHFEDREFICPTDKQVKDFLESFEPGEYIAEKNECATIAIKCVAHFAGTDWTIAYIKVPDGEVSHALCCYVNNKKQIKFLEPQTKTVYKPDKSIEFLLMTG